MFTSYESNVYNVRRKAVENSDLIVTEIAHRVRSTENNSDWTEIQ